MKIRTASAVLAAAMLSVAPLAVNASSTFHPSPNEPGTENHVSPGAISKAERAEIERLEAARTDPQWVFAAEAAGWELRPHSYELRGGRLVHTDALAHDTPKPALPRDGAQESYPLGGE